MQQTLSIAIAMAVSPKSKENLYPNKGKYGQGIATRAIRVPESLVSKILGFVDQQMNLDQQNKPDTNAQFRQQQNAIEKNSIEASENAESSEIKIKNDSLPSINIILFQDSEVHESTISSIRIDQISISFQGLP